MPPVSRRRLLGAAPLGLIPATIRAAPTASHWDTFTPLLQTLERQSGGRLGVAIADMQTGATAGHRMTERFAMCSTFKMLACGAVLHRVDLGQDNLRQSIGYSHADLVAYSPVTSTHVTEGRMTLGALCEAGMTRSDNTAANLILKHLGGPRAVTAFARHLGDTTSRLDRNETSLNTALPGDPRDTTTPAGMLADMHRLLAGDVLSPTSRTQLLAWLYANTTGNARLRAGVPADWRVGDKTGTGDQGTFNDIAILEPPGRRPVLACVYLTQSTLAMDAANALIAKIGAAISVAVGT